MPIEEVLSYLDQATQKEFDANRRLLSLDEYLALLAEHPLRQLRGSAQYTADMMDWFGTEPLRDGHALYHTGIQHRFKLFDQSVDAITRKVVGQEHVQNRIYRALRGFSRQGFNNKLLLLHGPNGSAKSSIAHALMSGMETYSNHADGSLYTFNWIFPVERYTRGGMGLNTYATSRDDRGTNPTSRLEKDGLLSSFAKIPDEEIAARIPCDMRDHPLLLIPRDQRKGFLVRLLGQAKAQELWEDMPAYLSQGEPCHRCKQIFDALLTANQGNLKKVLMHVQVERFYFARRYRNGLVTIEPQMHVDAQYHQLTYNKSVAALPASLQSLNLFTLTGDLIDGNRGLIEYSDLLKRPIDSFKYLLSACETGSVNVGTAIAYLDTVMIGSTNEIQLDAFKEFPDFTSFKARIELVRVPYLLSVTEESQIYSANLNQVAADKHVAPLVAWTTALWAVLTRLKKPNSINFSPQVSSIISNLTPLEKMKLYDSGETPPQLSPEEKKILKSTVNKVWEEYINIPYYEGRMGASAREMKSILSDAAQNPEFPCLTPLAVLRQLEEFVKRVSEYEFLKQDVKDGYHDATEFIATARSEYLNRIDLEVRDCIGLYDSGQWEDFLKKYIQQISLVLKKEKQKNLITGRLEDPDTSLVDEFERIVDAPAEAPEKEAFRQNIISQVGAWSLDHPRDKVVYAKVFPEFWRRLEKHYFESQKSLLTKMHDSLVVYGTGRDDTQSEGSRLARKTVDNMCTKLGYCEKCAKEVIIFLMKSRY